MGQLELCLIPLIVMTLTPKLAHAPTVKMSYFKNRTNSFIFLSPEKDHSVHVWYHKYMIVMVQLSKFSFA